MKSQRSVTENRNESAEPKKNEKAKETSANYGNVYNGELANIPTSHSREVPSMSAVSEKITTKKTPNKSQSKASRQSPQRYDERFVIHGLFNCIEKRAIRKHLAQLHKTRDQIHASVY